MPLRRHPGSPFSKLQNLRKSQTVGGGGGIVRMNLTSHHGYDSLESKFAGTLEKLINKLACLRDATYIKFVFHPRRTYK